MTNSNIRIALIAFSLCYVLVGMTIALQPSASIATDFVTSFRYLLRDVGVPDTFARGYRVEFVCNVAFAAPLSFLGMLLFPRTGWRDWTAWCFVLAIGVELAQGLVLSARSATFIDVVANTSGALAGGLVVALGRWWWSLRREEESGGKR